MADFSGTERYELLRRLGAGGMGIVYEVYDRVRNEHVALKTLSRVDPSGIYDLKREFRSLADVRHPNLVALHEIVNADGQWFFTMELLHGHSFSEYVEHDGQAERSAGDTLASHSPGFGPLIAERTPPKAPRADSPPFDEGRLRAALSQLVEGVGAIHAAGKLHRDLKPSNVLVTQEGRVVVLDFGLVQDDTRSGETADTSLQDNLVVGTPAYMAPEQAAGKRATAQSDWYAVGTMLYRALTGQLPFVGNIPEVLLGKQTRDPLAPSSLVKGLPEDLETLALGLLQRLPERRLNEAKLRKVLSLTPIRKRPIGRQPSRSFVGRELEQAQLQRALEASRRGRPQVVFVEADSGMGKTALVDHFLDKARADRNALVLSGRCYPRENLPYKAFDAIVDGLSRWLSRLPEASAAELLPRNRRALTGLFPVLERVPVIEAWESLASLPSSPVQRRERAFHALKELLGRISDGGPLILHLDNVQWGDADSADLLTALCSAPDPPAMLVIASHRRGADEGAFLARLGPGGEMLEEARRHTCKLEPLSPPEACALCAEALGSASPLSASLAHETRGDPLLITLVCAHYRRLSSSNAPISPNLNNLIELDIRALSADARSVLELLAVAGAPIDFGVAAAAAGLSNDARRACLKELQDANLVELSQHRGQEAASPPHERIAQTLLSSLSDEERRHRHLLLAKTLQSRPTSTPEALAEHFTKAGQTALALRYTKRSAARAAHGLAFDQAAVHYEQAVALADGDERHDLLLLLSDACLQLGDPGKAANALLAAARLTSGPAATALRQRAASLRLTDTQLEGLFGDSRGAESLFDGVARDEVQQFLAGSEIVEANCGELVSRHGDVSASVLVVLAGELASRQAGGDVAFGPGEILGTLSFLQNAPRTTDVRATQEQTRVLRITRRSLDELSKAQPHLALQLTVNLARILCAKLLSVHARAFGP